MRAGAGAVDVRAPMRRVAIDSDETKPDTVLF
jgi:hypothetical protein